MFNNTTNLQNYFALQTFDIQRIFAEFNKEIFNNVFWQNREGLQDGADLVKFTNDKWVSYPLNFCQDHYNNQYLYPIVILVNNLGSMFDFKPENLPNQKIIAPQVTTILEVLSNARY